MRVSIAHTHTHAHAHTHTHTHTHTHMHMHMHMHVRSGTFGRALLMDCHEQQARWVFVGRHRAAEIAHPRVVSWFARPRLEPRTAVKLFIHSAPSTPKHWAMTLHLPSVKLGYSCRGSGGAA